MKNWIQWLSGLDTVRRYEAAWLPHDIVAGLVLATMLVPVGIAYAEASGLAGVYGLYATIVPLMAYALFGPSRIFVLGPDSALAAVILGVVVPLSGGDPVRAVIHRRIIKELNAAGFKELREPHMAVLQFPGPDGVRPGTLAERAGLSKQAMNQLLRSLEGLGYIVRSDAPDEAAARIIGFTKRGRAAYSKIHDILRDIEREWSAELGATRFGQLKELLCRVWNSPLIR